MSTTDPAPKTPALFLGHGSPMNAVEENEFTEGWRAAARTFRKPVAVLCISAHWETLGIAVTATEKPETIHDFYGFPRELFAARYPAPGDPTLARRTADLLAPLRVHLDPERGLDHGAWSVLRAMYPDANVPIVQLSLDSRQPASTHVRVAQSLAPLRDEGVLILGSGNLVHNLGLIDFHRSDGFDWAVRFDREIKERVRSRDHGALVEYDRLGPDARLAVPTPEHYLPLLYMLAIRKGDEPVSFFNDRVTMGSISMTCVALGLPGAGS